MSRTGRYWRFAATVAAALTLASGVRAQYVSYGQEPASVRWLQVESSCGKLVFPSLYSSQAVRMMHYIDFVAPGVGYGFTRGPMQMPVLVHANNFSSNGVVVMAPHRMELIATPPPSTYATPWHKQLIAHEMRHRVQMNNLNRNVIGVLGKILGQHGSAIGVAFMPIWAMEGDAVHAETQMSAFGRALQPSFTMGYRAMLMEGVAADYPADKFFSGSFTDYLPSHYHVGYQITSYAWSKYGENVWDKVTDYGSRRPYQLFTTHIALKKYYKTKSTTLLRETLAALESHWRSLPAQENTARIIPTPTTSYTTYTTPVEGTDGYVYALKSDFDRVSRIVCVDPQDGSEKVLHRTGTVNTGLVLSGDRLWWTELRPSMFWEQKNYSQLCWYDLAKGRGGRESSHRTALFPTPIHDGDVAYLEYDRTGHYEICTPRGNIAIPDTVTVHGLAYEREKYWFIGLSDSGMWLGTADPATGRIAVATPPGHTTLANLRSGDERLYYNSIASGQDEAYAFDPDSGEQFRMTGSRYGSFDPSPAADGGLLVTTYTPQGYLLARQEPENSPAQATAFEPLPRNIFNLKAPKWEVPSVDDYATADTTSRGGKHYRKGLHLFNFHSWAPAHYEPDNLLKETELNVNLGVSLLSQNLLGSAFTALGYKYTEEGSFVTGGFKYHGLAPKFEVEAEYGTMDQLAYIPAGLDPEYVKTLNPKRGNYFEITARAYLPMQLSGGYHLRMLTPSVELEHTNSKLFYLKGEDEGHFRNGMQKMKLSLMFTDNVRMAYRDLLPRWGYALRVTHTSNPFNSRFGSLWSGYGRAYLPGVLPHHSFMVRTGVQTADFETYNFRQKEVFPRGAKYDFTPERYGSLALDYQFPIWYPDGGITSLLYFRRVRLNLCYDYARYKSRGKWDDIHSYGVDITLDFVPVRLPASSNASFTFTLHKPTDRGGVVLGANFAMTL